MSEVKGEREEGSRRRHGKSLFLRQSQELFVNVAAPRQRLVRGWHAAGAGCVGVTSALGPRGLKTQGSLSGEEGQTRAGTHCGNRAVLAAWGPNDGEAYLEMSPDSPLEMEETKKSPCHPPADPQHSLTPFLFHPTPALFALSSLPFLCT